MWQINGDWNGKEVVCHYVADLDAWIFVCISTYGDGRSGGGTRLKLYESPEQGLADCMRLADTMASKMAAADLPLGGAKAVIALGAQPSAETRSALLDRLAALIRSLEGRFVTGPDSGTNEEDMDYLYERCPGIFGSRAGRLGDQTISQSTAHGVLCGIEATIESVGCAKGLAGARVVVQGLGAVGVPLAELLVGAGAEVVVTDLDKDQASREAARLGATSIPVGEALSYPCDVLAPCAIGGVIGPEEVSSLRCRIVAGAANNPLSGGDTATLLAARGIVYAPDFVINAGGVLHGFGVEALGWDREELFRRLRGIGMRLTEIYAVAAKTGVTSVEAARDRFISPGKL
jgi:leucine dehydrogenase